MFTPNLSRLRLTGADDCANQKGLMEAEQTRRGEMNSQERAREDSIHEEGRRQMNDWARKDSFSLRRAPA